MRSLFQMLFYSPKYGKIDDKTMMLRVITGVVTVVLCLSAMGFAAYAYFSHDVTSGFNILKAAKFETTILIEVIDDNGTVTESFHPITSNYKTFKADLEAGKTYTITVKPTEKSTAKTGFLIVQAKNGNKVYHTQQLGDDANAPGGRTESVTFYLELTNDDEVQFLAHWGTSSHYAEYQDEGIDGDLYITHGETVTLSVQLPVTEPPMSETPSSQETENIIDSTSGVFPLPTEETHQSATDSTSGVDPLPTEETPQNATDSTSGVDPLPTEETPQNATDSTSGVDPLPTEETPQTETTE